ncbi:zinc-binding dehydrogenase [Zooshikella sp. RANM57]|uniref:zinc-binding dehydrogenase n=1 Tax=Zooshikella sp. RANM57 TaxID=3425863 RepID=UPI003D6F145C
MERQVWQVKKTGSLNRMELVQQIMSPLADNHVRIKVKAIGLNYADIFSVFGLYSATPKGRFTPGLEVSGIVVATGKAVSNYRIGQAVIAVTRFGGYSSLIDCTANYIWPLPDKWHWNEGAAWLVQTLTAWYGLCKLANVQSAQTVLIHSAAGGVGLRAMQLVKALGGKAYGVVGTATKKQFLEKQGFSALIRNKGAYAKQLQSLPEKGVDVVLDAIGGKIQQAAYRFLNPQGKLVVFGAANFTPVGQKLNWLRIVWQFLVRPRYDPLAMMSNNISIHAFNLIWLWDQQTLLNEGYKAVQQLHLPKPFVGRSYSFSQAIEALDYLRSGQSIGKVVLMV